MTTGRTGQFALAVLLAFGIGATTARAQSEGAPDNAAGNPQTDSLATASRRALAQKKEQSKAAKVYTNDNLPTNATISILGSAPGSSEAAPSAASNTGAGDQNNAQPTGASGSDNQKNDADSAALAEAKEKLASLKKDLDIDQRKYTLDQQSYLSNPNHESDNGTATSLQSEQDAISAKQDEVDAQQKVVESLQTKAQAAAPASNSSSSDSSAPASNGAVSTDTNTDSSTSSSPAVSARGTSITPN